MFSWLQHKLGISSLRTDMQFSHDVLLANIANLRNDVAKLQTQLGAIAPGLGRVIAKLDPMVAKSEFDPERIAESKRLGEEVIKRLEGEDLARKYTTGEVT